MLHPVGSLPPSVYWRRRLLLLAAAIVLTGLTAWVLRPGNSSTPNAGANKHPSSSNAALTSPAVLTTPQITGTVGSTHSATGASPTGTSTAGATPTTCTPTQLKIAAVASKATYKVGDQPELMLQVTNSSTRPCVQDLSDSQVELRVYNGESRVWGSHDCEIQPGTANRTLMAGQAVRVSIVWSGLSSQPKCAGTRQRVGAGTYTLYAYLSGRTGTAEQFSIS